jgi:dolichyl-phosphate beta-glucosyltransferase
LVFRSAHTLPLLSPWFEKLLARLIRAYAPRSISTLALNFPGLSMAGEIPLHPTTRGGDVLISPVKAVAMAGHLVILISLSRGDDRAARQAVESAKGYELREHFYFGFFILPFLWLQHLPGGGWLLGRIFALETRLYPYINPLAGIGALSVFEKRRVAKDVLPRPRISCVIPAYNEAERLPTYLPLVQKYFRTRKIKYEIIVADDGSRDGTAAVIGKKFRDVRTLKLYENFGKGAAVREGVLAAEGQYVLVADADGATPIEEIARLEAAITEGADAAIGSRYLKESAIGKKQGIFRRIVSRVGNLLIRSLLDLPYRDTQCGFKLFERRAAQYLFRNLRNIRFGFDFEILKKASVLQLNVAEVPVRWNDQAGSKVTFRLTLRVLSELIRFRFGHLIKFAFVGIINTLADFSVHNGLIAVFGYGGSLRQLIYMVAAFLCANLLAFCLHSGFTFQKRAAYRRFFTVSVFTLTLAALIFHGLNILYNKENDIFLTNIFKLSTVIVSFMTNYFGYRFWVYRYVM